MDLVQKGFRDRRQSVRGWQVKSAVSADVQAAFDVLSAYSPDYSEYVHILYLFCVEGMDSIV